MNTRQKKEVTLERKIIKEEQRILVKEFIQGIILGLLGGFLLAYLILG